MAHLVLAPPFELNQGWFRLAKGVDNLGVESQECSWATPKKTW